jgi:hypothetical protein
MRPKYPPPRSLVEWSSINHRGRRTRIAGAVIARVLVAITCDLFLDRFIFGITGGELE